ncbi:hypothetical protein XEUV678_23130 [Xanthomonas euvesicatoria]|nr:hypothetical protein XEUV678_23130 [Xanthomonas euvesicatoria]
MTVGALELLPAHLESLDGKLRISTAYPIENEFRPPLDAQLTSTVARQGLNDEVSGFVDVFCLFLERFKVFFRDLGA